jgi:ferrous iron transport protein B
MVVRMSQAMKGNRVKKVAIVGLPNTGKTQIFNNLTGEYHLVANYPLTTISVSRAHGQIGQETYEIIDTPGIHSLYVDSEDERIARDLILNEPLALIIQCVDARQLRQSLNLTADLLGLELPIVIALNAVDETSKKGVWIDSRELSRLLNIPVVESVAVSSKGTRALKGAVIDAGEVTGGIFYGDRLEKEITAIAPGLPEDLRHKRQVAILFLMGDPLLEASLEKSPGTQPLSSKKAQIIRQRKQLGGNIGRILTKKRSDWADQISAKVVKKQKGSMRQIAAVVARMSRHPLLGTPILLMIVYLTYLLVVHVANNIADWMNTILWVPVENAVSGILPSGFWHDFLIGEYGILSLGLANAIITVLPILSVFFIVLHILEDSGYIPNLSVLTKRIFERLGLSGGAIMPLVLGFGCKTMATLTTKSLHSKRERYISIYLIAFAIPCAPQMGLNMSILGRMGTGAFITTFAVLFIVEIAAGLILNGILKKEEKSYFLQELPPMRLPSPKAVMVKTCYRLYWFLKEAIPVFIYAAMALFAIDKLGILAATKRVLSPLIKGLLGLPLEMVDALILCMARHEAAVAVIINLMEQGKLNYRQCIVAVTIATMFVPCFANIMAMVRELGTRQALMMALVINISAFIIAGGLNWTLIGMFNLP